jgi:hypothetical protein
VALSAWDRLSTLFARVASGILTNPDVRHTAIAKHQSDDTIDWVIGIVGVGVLAVIGTGLATRRRGHKNQQAEVVRRLDQDVSRQTPTRRRKHDR